MTELVRRGSFLVAHPSPGPACPREMSIAGRTWYRFMDRIYCPSPVHLLTPTLVAELCELRLDLVSVIRDEHVYDSVAEHLTQLATACLTRHTAQGRLVLDFGTGNGEFLRRLSDSLPARVFGCDISYTSLRQAARPAGVVQVSTDGLLPFRTGSIDLVSACFVMHFGLPARVFTEFTRVTRGGGHLCASFYGSGGERSARLLLQAGWVLVDDAPVRDVAGHRVKAFARP